MQPLSSYTLADPKVMQNPYPYYARLRAEDPVHFDEGIRTWLVTRHEDIVAVARDTEVYSDEMRVSGAIRSPFRAEVDEYMQREGFLVLDPSDSFKIDGELHTRRRKLVANAFTGPAVTAMETRVAAICRDKAAAFLGRERSTWSGNMPCPYPSLSSAMRWDLPMDRVDEVSGGADSMVARSVRARPGKKPTSIVTTSCSCTASYGRLSRSAASNPALISSHCSFMRAAKMPQYRS